MAIEKNNVKVAVSKLEPEFSVVSRIRDRDSMSSDEDEFRRKNSVDSEEDDEEFDDADSGAGSDDFDLLELGETGSEFCQVGDQTCCVPFELYDLSDLRGILSLDVWNECLTEEEKFGLTKYLPDMDQEMFLRTLNELFEGGDFNFGNPVDMMYQMLKGGLCEPRVALYRQGLNFFQKHQHYHLLHKHQDSMVASLLQMREAWQNCKGYGIEEKLRVLNIMRSQKSLMAENNDGMGSDSSERESADAIWSMRSKERSFVQKVGREPSYGTGPALDVFSCGRKVAVDSFRDGKPNSRKLMAGSKSPKQNEPAQHFRHGHLNIKTSPGDDERERVFEMDSQRDWNIAQGNMMDRVRAMKCGKKLIAPGSSGYDLDKYDNYSTHHPAKARFSDHGRNVNINQLSDIKVLTAKPSNVRGFYVPAKRARYGDTGYGDQASQQMDIKQNMGNDADVAEQYWSKKTPRQPYFTDPSSDYMGKAGDTRKMNAVKEVPISRFKTLQALGNRMDYRSYVPEQRSMVFQDNIRGVRKEGSSMFPLKSERMVHGGDDTESDSSDQLEEGGKRRLIMSNRAMYGRLENPRSSLSGSINDKEKRAMRNVKGSSGAFEGMLPSPSTMSDFGRHMQSQEMNNYYLKSRQSAHMQHLDASQNLTSRFTEIPCYVDPGNTNTGRNRISAYMLGRNGQGQGLPVPMNSAFPFERRLPENVGHETLSRKLKHMQDYSLEENGVRFEGSPMRRGNRVFDATLIGCTSTAKKHKRKDGLTEIDEHEGSDYMQSHEPVFESISLKNRGKKRQEDNGFPDTGLSEQPAAEVVVEEVVQEIKPPKKPSPLITPTVHTSFTFSVIHLLSAVRVSLITPTTVDSSAAQKTLENPVAAPKDQKAKLEQTNDSLEKIDVNNPALENPGAGPEDQKAKHEQTNGTLEMIDVNNPALENPGAGPEDQKAKHEQTNGALEKIDVNNPTPPEQTSVPSLTVHEVVNNVRLNPGDPKILETQEPLQDLVRGVLKVFSSKTAPLGAKSWKPLISYYKSTKRWSWTGPGLQTPADDEPPESVTSPEAWGIPRKMLIKIVDSFANWLKCGQETLQQIGSLPEPPAELTQLNFDEKERFKDLRAQKSLPTFSPSSDEVRAYFHKEEQLRYSVPDRAFSYTAADGKKSIVAPLRRCGGKPTSKARDHFMLKPDRPPHVTILCLLRDAAARLPGSIGTRADVCTLIRDSQYMVEEVSDAQVNQVISGALDRLHYERDPCVQFDGERKLWVYLHRSREEEDFEDDGTSSTKKWKRQKKDASEQEDQVTVACPESSEPTGLDPSSDLNVEPPGKNDDKVVEQTFDDKKEILEDDSKLNHTPEQGSMPESGSLCLENSKNEYFDDKA